MTLTEMVRIEAARFRMGSTDEEVERCVEEWASRLVDPTYSRSMFRSWIAKESPAYEVSLASFSIARFPVTNGEYRDFVRETSARAPESLVTEAPGDHPVWGVTELEIEAFLGWASERTGLRLRLPTEAEWEFAARGHRRREFPYGDAFSHERCNTIEAGIGTTTSVHRYEAYPSDLGVCDLAGNVEEWTSSDYVPYPGGAFVHDHLTEQLGVTYRVLRGGSFARGGDLARGARRHGPIPDPAFRFFGFRVAAD
jgi:toxoflavin biosynthesis protein ToxD